MRFRATVELHGKTATGIEVPAAVVAELGHGQRPPVTATLNGHSYRTMVGSRGGRFLIPVSAQVRQDAGITAGDVVDVDVELDDAPRTVTVPDDLAAALAADAAAGAAFARMSYSHQLQHVLAVEGARTAETRQRRIAKAVADLGQA
jgi:bifunctional DNA-binding transcriptional regulator/antitoxin component of YhaV-PrlF toxin-antitoxin module